MVTMYIEALQYISACCFTSLVDPVSFPVYFYFSYLREVGFPDNVLEARVSRMTAYKNLYGQSQMMEQPPMSNRSDSPVSTFKG